MLAYIYKITVNVIVTTEQAEGSKCGGINLPPLVGIGMTDLPKSGGGQ